MAQKNINARIKNKRDTSANWDKNNPVLLNGEIIIVDMPTGEVRYKTGDGVKAYKQLPFDDEAIKAQITQLQNSIPDVSKYVIADEAGAIVDTVPPTFDGHTASEFVLKANIVDNLTSTATDAPLSANQGKVLKGSIDSLGSKVGSVETTANNKLNKSGGTLTGKLIAQSNTDYSTAQVHNIIMSTAEPSGGNNGDIWIRFKG